MSERCKACGGAPRCTQRYWRRDHDWELTTECDRLLGAEIEWACRIAAESFGLNWPRLEEQQHSSPASSPLSPVDAEDLAQSLDSLLEVIPKNCMGELCQRSTRSEQLIARYHAQQCEPSKPALSEVEQLALKLLTEYTLWSDTGRCNHDLIELSEQLREALRKRGAL